MVGVPLIAVLEERRKQEELARLLQQGRAFRPSFTPEGDQYDFQGALAAGIRPTMDGHWPSRQGDETGLILKGRAHPTFDLAVEGEREAGNTIYQKAGDDRYYSGRVGVDDAGQTWIDGKLQPPPQRHYQPGLASPQTLAHMVKAFADHATPQGFLSHPLKSAEAWKSGGKMLYDALKETVTLPERVATGELPLWDPETRHTSLPAIEQATNFGLNTMLGASVVPEKLAVGAGERLAANKWYHGTGKKIDPEELTRNWNETRPLYFAPEEDNLMAKGYARERGNWDDGEPGPGDYHVHEAELDESKFMDPERYREILAEKFPEDSWLDHYVSEADTVRSPEMTAALREGGHTGVKDLWDFWMDRDFTESPVAAVVDPSVIKFLGANKSETP